MILVYRTSLFKNKCERDTPIGIKGAVQMYRHQASPLRATYYSLGKCEGKATCTFLHKKAPKFFHEWL